MLGIRRYFEWLKKGKDRLPHFTKRQDGKLLLLAGLYDSVLLEGKSSVTPRDAHRLNISFRPDRNALLIHYRNDERKQGV